MRAPALGLLLVALPLFAFPKIGPRHPVGEQTLVGPTLVSGGSVRGAAVDGGFLAVWADETKTIHASRLDTAGSVVATGFARVSVTSILDALLLASDGSQAVVTVNLSSQSAQYVVARVASDAAVVVVAVGTGEVRALTWNGTAYIALVHRFGALSVVELDAFGREVKQLPLTTPRMDQPYVYPQWITLSRVLFSDGGTAWLAGQTRNQLWLAALTDESGHIAEPRLTTLDIDMTNQALLGAGATSNGFFLLTTGSVKETVAHFLDRDFSGEGRVVVGRSPSSYAYAHWTRTGLLVFDVSGEARIVRVSRSGSVDALDAGAWKNLQEFSGPSDVVAGRAGALLLGRRSIQYEDRTFRAPAAVFVRGLVPGRPLRISEPVSVSRAVPDGRAAAAVAHADGFLVVWQRPGIWRSEIWAQRFAIDGTPGTPRFIASGARPLVASQGDVALIAWTRTGTVEAIRVDRDAIPIDEQPFAVTRGVFAGLMHIGFDGTEFHVFYGVHPRLHAASVTPFEPAPRTLESKVVLDPNYTNVDMVTAPGGTLLVGRPWSSSVPTVAVVSPELTLKGPPKELTTLHGSYVPVWNGEHFIVTWIHLDHLRSARVTESGELLDSEFGQALANVEGDGRRTSPGYHKAAADGDRLFVATPDAVTEMRPLARPERTVLSGPSSERNIAALARRPDGTMLLVYTVDVYAQVWTHRVIFAHAVTP